MRIALILFVSLILLACQSNKTSNKEPALAQPNILIILVDDLGKEWVSSYGAEDIQTPHIDALAESGMKFHNAYSMPQCTPTRLTFLTGQYPFRHGWVNHWDVPRWGGGAHYDENLNPSIGKEMKKAGYRTCVAGKWQIDDFRVEPDALSRNGFDEYCMWTGYEGGIPASGERYQDPYLFTKAGSRTYPGKFGPDVFKDFIIDFIKQPKQQPFFVYFPMVLTHTPFVNTPDEMADDKLGKHKAMVRYTDKITGQLVQTLAEAGLRENTLIIWTTDNGTTRQVEGTYQGRKIQGGKARTTESGICAPFIASWPAKISAGQETDALIDFTDFYPTCLDLAGVDLSTLDSTYPLDGRSFKSVLTGDKSGDRREWILGMGGGNNAKLTEKGVENQYHFRDRVLRNKRYKLYLGSDRQAAHFFDLKADPFEGINLMDSLSVADRQSNFDQLLQVALSFPEKDSEPRYIPNPPHEWDVEVTAESQVWKKK